MLRVLILIFATIAILLCLLQEDKNEGILSLNVKKYTAKDERTKLDKILKIATVVDVCALFISLFIEMF